jgi:hypothetical protein
MQRLILVFLSTLCFSSVNSHAVQAGVPRLTSAGDHAVIQRRKIVLARSPRLVKQFPFKRRANVVYPVVNGLSAPVLRRVRSVLDFKNIFDYSLKEYREDTWLEEFSYVVNHNGNFLQDITFSQSGSAAYPDEQSRHFLINLRDGRVIKASDVFITRELAQLSALVNLSCRKSLKRFCSLLENQTVIPKTSPSPPRHRKPLEFKVENLDDFSVSAKGVTFLYDAGYPHAIRAFEPIGRYFFN